MAVARFMYKDSTPNTRLNRKYAKIFKEFEGSTPNMGQIPVIGINIKTGKEVRYDSAFQAEKAIGKTRGAVSGCILGHTKTSGGFYWKKDLDRVVKKPYDE
jgi:hypothetical protein